MARSPFQGNYNPNARPTIVTAPDAVVYINGDTDLVGCPNCNRKFDLSKYITSIQTNLNVDGGNGSATISLSIPRHAVDDFFFDSNPIITEMMEVEIYAKGFYTLEGLPQYYPIFWGLVTEVTDDYSGGEHTVSIQCADILKWWDLCRMNVNPAITVAPGQTGTTLTGNTFQGMNPYDVIWTLAQQSFGDVVIGTGSLNTVTRENGVQSKVFKGALTDIMMYWEERFTRVRSNLMLYGVNGALVRGSSLNDYYQTGKDHNKKIASTAVRRANGGDKATQAIFDPSDPEVQAFRTQNTSGILGGQVNFWQSEYQTKLEIAQAAKEAVGFEFYMDVTGDIVFKPPFFNLDVLKNKPISWIQDIDVIDWSFSQSEAEVVTQLQMQGNYTGNQDWGMPEEVTPITSVTDYHLLRKYGWRSQPYNSEFMASPTLMFFHGLDILDRINSRRHHASISIPMRPELRLGFPIYVAPKDSMWYVHGISHNIQFGGRATTQLDLTARRSKWVAPNGIGTLTLKTPVGTTDTKTLQEKGQFHLEVGEAAFNPPLTNDLAKSNAYQPLMLRHPKTGRLMGYPNVVMVYTRPMKEEELKTLNVATAKKKPGTTQGVKNNSEIQNNQQQEADKFVQGLINENRQKLREKHMTNRYSYGLTSAGVYVYAYEKQKSIQQFLLMSTKNLTVTQNKQDISSSDFLQGASGMVRPVSDERGFEVIGHFRYGRGISLRDGSLVLSDTGTNNKVDVQAQVALGGGLFETLQAQSQGLTTISNGYPNPAVALANLTAEDTQTSAIGNPTDGYRYTSGPDRPLVESAPLGSPSQKGLPLSVEASQLSRAITLAELTALNQDVDATDCVCMTGRADLAFINVGYQVKVLNPSSDVAAYPGTTTASPNSDPPVPASSLTFASIRDNVSNYLTNLYKVLDEQHQFLEENLRGGINSIPNRLSGNLESPVDLFQTEENQSNNFAPPFSSMNRAGLGDPIALAQQGSSAETDLANAFKRFGNDLSSKTKVTSIQGDINQLNHQVDTNQAKIAQLKGTLQVTDDPNTRVSLQSQISGLETSNISLNNEIAQKQSEITRIQSNR